MEQSERPQHPESERAGRPDAPARGEILQIIRDAIAGHEGARRELYRCYNPLIVSVARQYRLSADAVEDVSQNVWGRLVTHLGGISEPLALPGWIVTTTRNEALRVHRAIDAAPRSTRRPIRALERVDRADPARTCSVRAGPRARGDARPSSRPVSVASCSCSWPTRSRRTRRSAGSWACRSAASGRPAPGAWRSFGTARGCARPFCRMPPDRPGHGRLA